MNYRVKRCCLYQGLVVCNKVLSSSAQTECPGALTQMNFAQKKNTSLSNRMPGPDALKLYFD